MQTPTDEVGVAHTGGTVIVAKDEPSIDRIATNPIMAQDPCANPSFHNVPSDTRKICGPVYRGRLSEKRKASAMDVTLPSSLSPGNVLPPTTRRPTWKGVADVPGADPEGNKGACCV